MTSEYIISNVVTDTATIGKFQNIVPLKGSIYGSDGSTYTKVPLGNNGDSLTADSTAAQGLSWKPYANIASPTIVFTTFSCVGFQQNAIVYSTFSTNSPEANHDQPNILSFSYDAYVTAFGVKPRATTTRGNWASSLATLWNGTLYFDIVGTTQDADPALGMTPMTTPPAPHFTLTNAEVTSIYMAKNWIPTTPIFIPANTKFCIRASWAPGTIFNDTQQYFCTGNLIISATP